MLDQALEDLKTFDFGKDPKTIAPIDEACLATRDDAAKRKDLEDKLAATLKNEMPLDAKQYVCRKLMQIGTAASVPALAALLADKQLSHMARYALERIPAPEAAAALRDSLGKLPTELKVGVIGSLGGRKAFRSSADCSVAAMRPWLARQRSLWAPFVRRKPRRLSAEQRRRANCKPRWPMLRSRVPRAC